MPSVIKVKGSETAVTTATNLSNAQLIRVYASANSVITVADSNDTTLGSFTMPGGSVDYVEKKPSDKISADVQVLCTAIAYNS